MFKTLPWASLYYFGASLWMFLPLLEPPWRVLFSLCPSCKQGSFSPDFFFGTIPATDLTQQLFCALVADVMGMAQVTLNL